MVLLYFLLFLLMLQSIIQKLFFNNLHFLLKKNLRLYFIVYYPNLYHFSKYKVNNFLPCLILFYCHFPNYMHHHYKFIPKFTYIYLIHFNLFYLHKQVHHLDLLFQLNHFNNYPKIYLISLHYLYFFNL